MIFVHNEKILLLALTYLSIFLPQSLLQAQSEPSRLDTMTIHEIAQSVCSGSITSTSLVSDYLARIKAKPQLNAFITLDEIGAMKAAREIDAGRQKSGACMPLTGVPVVIKDNIQVHGLPTTAGTPALRNFTAKADAPVVARLRAAGAVVLGQTNMHELAFGLTGYNPTFHSSSEIGVRNAYDVSRIAGGSSSGNAAALGARIALAALGTDTSGSVRVPCSFNGCVAFRPTIGRYPQQGIVPLSHTRDTAGPMALSVADMALLDEVITGDQPFQSLDLKSVRLGVVSAFYANLDSDTQAATDAALAKLRAAGVTLVNVEMPGVMELDEKVSFPVLFYEAHDDLTEYLKTYNTGIDIHQLAAQIISPDVKSAFDNLIIPRKVPTSQGAIDGKASYNYAIRIARPALQQLYRNTFIKNRLDALVFPTVPRVAPIATPEVSSLEIAKALIQNTDPGSNAGIPGLQLPSGLGATTGLPIGLELDGPAGSDRQLLSLGLAIENVLGRLPAPK